MGGEVQENSSTDLLLERGREGHQNSHFGSEPSGLLKPASFAETQAAKQSLSSKVIVSICEGKTVLMYLPLKEIPRKSLSSSLCVLFGWSTRESEPQCAQYDLMQFKLINGCPRGIQAAFYKQQSEKHSLPFTELKKTSTITPNHTKK